MKILKPIPVDLCALIEIARFKTFGIGDLKKDVVSWHKATVALKKKTKKKNHTHTRC